MAKRRPRARTRSLPPKQAAPSNLLVTDQLMAAYFAPGGLVDLAGSNVSEATALNLSAVFRAVSLISGTLASLPLDTLKEKNGETVPAESIFDDPDGPDGQTQFEWEETLFAHLVIHGKAGAIKVRNGAGALTRLPLVHPLSFKIEDPTPEERDSPEKMPKGGVWFRVALEGGKNVKLDAHDFWYIPAMSLDGQTGLGLLQVARGSLGTSISGDHAASKMFSGGALISGLASPEDDLEVDEVTEIKRALDQATLGTENVGKIAIVNRRLKFTPWTMSAVDAQFLQSRQFQIEEISRWTGVPPHLLMQTEKQTSWGTGVEEQNRALGRTVLNPWACRLEGRGSRLLNQPRWLRIDFSGLERPSPDKEIELLLAQTGKPFLTVNEARKIRNLPPIAGGDELTASAKPPATTSAEPPVDPEEEDGVE